MQWISPNHLTRGYETNLMITQGNCCNMVTSGRRRGRGGGGGVPESKILLQMINHGDSRCISKNILHG